MIGCILFPAEFKLFPNCKTWCVAMNLLSIFAGSGGATYGFSNIFSPILAVEERLPEARTLVLNIPLELRTCFGFVHAEKNKAYQCDVRQISFKQLAGDVDVLLATPPSSDFSIAMAGRRKGIAGRKGSLLLEVPRVAKEAQPSMVVLEEVEGLLSTNKGRDWLFFVQEMRSVGYHLAFRRILNYAGFGVPQNKRRLVAVFTKQQSQISNLDIPYDRLLLRCPMTPLEVFEGLPIDHLQNQYADFLDQWKSEVQSLEQPFASLIQRELSKLSGDIIEDYIRLNSACSRKVIDVAFDRHKEVLKELGYFGKRVWKGKEVPSCLKPTIERMKRIPPGKGIEVLKGTKYWKKTNVSLAYRRIHPIVPSYTLPANAGGGTYGYHYLPSRCALTNEERKRLQTFPDDYVFLGSGIEKRRQITDSMPPLAAKRISEAIVGFI